MCMCMHPLEVSSIGEAVAKRQHIYRSEESTINRVVRRALLGGVYSNTRPLLLLRLRGERLLEHHTPPPEKYPHSARLHDGVHRPGEECSVEPVESLRQYRHPFRNAYQTVY